MLHLLRSYLSCQKLRVKQDSHFLGYKLIHSGVRQGLALAPMLHTVHVSDKPRKPGMELSKFADYIAALTKSTNTNYAISSLQRFVSKLEAWLCKWRIHTNADKSTAAIFTKV
jgi:hypothetical protein